MKTNFSKINLSFIVLLALSTSCKKPKEVDPNSNTTQNPTTLKKDVLVDISANVIHATYMDMNVKAQNLHNAVVTLSISTNSSNLQNAQQAWKDVRSAWEQAEGFLFGPVSIDNIDPRIDTWPVDFARLDSVLSTSTPFTSSYVDNLEDALKGFHPIEYLLFGNNGSKSASSFTIREIDYLIALSENLKTLCQQAENSWNPSIALNYTFELNNAGAGSNVYQTQRAAYEEIIDAMIGICDEVANAKIAEPFINQNPALEESPFASNSMNDFTNNIKSVQNLYLGKYSADGKGLEDLIKASNLSMDGQIKTKIANALNALNNITVPFGQAIVSQQTQIQNCITAINDLKSYLDQTTKPYLQTITN